jgi:hypothetical protein
MNLPSHPPWWNIDLIGTKNWDAALSCFWRS